MANRNHKATSDTNGQATDANFSLEKSEEPASRSDDVTTSTVVTSTEHPQDNSGEPESSWSSEQLGEYACVEHKCVVKIEHDSTLHTWLLGKALTFAKTKVPPGGWMAYCERFGLDKNRVSRSMRLVKKYPNKNDVKGKSVAELLRNVNATPRKKKVAAASPLKEQPKAEKGPLALGTVLAANGIFRLGQFSVQSKTQATKNRPELDHTPGPTPSNMEQTTLPDMTLSCQNEVANVPCVTSPEPASLVDLLTAKELIQRFLASPPTNQLDECGSCLDEISEVGDEAEWSWAICQAVLLLHAQNAGLPVMPAHMKGSFEAIARQLAKLVKDSN